MAYKDGAQPIQIPLDAETIAKLKAMADDYCVSINEMVRMMLRKHIKSNWPPKLPNPPLLPNPMQTMPMTLDEALERR